MRCNTSALTVVLKQAQMLIKGEGFTIVFCQHHVQGSLQDSVGLLRGGLHTQPYRVCWLRVRPLQEPWRKRLASYTHLINLV